MKAPNLFLKIFAYLLFIVNSFVLVRMANLFGMLIDNLSNSQFEVFRENIIIIAIYALITLIIPVIAYKIAFKISNMEMNTLKQNKFSSEFINSKIGFNLVDYTQNLELYYSGQLMNKFNIVNVCSVFIFTVISIINIDIRIFVIAFICSFLPLIIPILSQKTLQERSRTFIDSSDSYTKFIEDKLNGKKELIRYDGLNWVKSIHKGLSEDHEDKRESFKSLNVLNNVFSEGISSISQVVILFSGGIFVLRSIISVGNVITLLQLMNYLAGPIVTLVSLYNNHVSSLVAKKRLIEDAYMDNLDKDLDGFGSDDANVAIEIDEVDFAYGDKKIFNNINYRFMKGKSYLVKGKSGSGKSTLLKLIAGELEPDNGNISIFGRDIENLDKSEIYRTISYISQGTHIFENSVKDNILLGKTDEENKSEKVVEILELDLSLENLLNKERNVSGGEAVRIGIGRSLIEPKEIIILDEHTSGLNEDLAFRITKEILDLGKTVICVSHTESNEILDLFDEHISIEDFMKRSLVK